MTKKAGYTRIIVLVAAFVLSTSAVLLSSCASTPSPDSGEGTLLAIPALYFSTAPVDLQTSVYYNVTIYNLDTDTKYTVRFPSYKGDDYILIDFLPEGTYRITEYESKGFPENIRMMLQDPLDFFVKKGEIMLTPYKYVSRIDENPQTKFHTYYIDWVLIDEKQRERMMDIFRNNPDYAAWVIK